MTGPVPALRLGSPIVADFGLIAREMRPDEVAQYLALTGLATYHPEVAARGLIAAGGESYALVGRDGLPVLLGGFVPVRPGVVEAWAAGSVAGWAQHWIGITKACRRLMADVLTQAHRIETCALASRSAAHRWYERGLGMHRDGVLPGYFADGQDGIMFSLTRARA